MNFPEYQKASERTMGLDRDRKELLANFAMGLAGEAGETVDLLKKAIFHGHPADPDKLAKELGDVLFYVTALASVSGISLESIAQGNVEKLLKRYPAGFSTEASLNRKEGA
jgi:NTP pyrophosphatase (non-canonical NTP hydrolase)